MSQANDGQNPSGKQSAKQFVDDLRDTVGKKVADNESTLRGSLGKAARWVDQRTGGKYSQQIGRAESRVGEGIGWAASQGVGTGTSSAAPGAPGASAGDPAAPEDPPTGPVGPPTSGAPAGPGAAAGPGGPAAGQPGPAGQPGQSGHPGQAGHPGPSGTVPAGPDGPTAPPAGGRPGDPPMYRAPGQQEPPADPPTMPR